MNATIHPTAVVDPRAELGDGVEIGPGAIIGPNVRLGDGTRVGSHALVTGWTRVGYSCRLHHGAVLGTPPQDLKYPGEPSYLEVGDHTTIREYTTLNLATEPGATTRVGSHCLLMAYAHVAHNCHIGDHVVVANLVQFGGYVTVEDWAIVGGGSVVHQFVRIGRHSMIGGGSLIVQDVAPCITVAGNRVRLGGVNSIGLQRRGIPSEEIAALESAYRILFRGGRSITDAVATLRERFAGMREVMHLARFAETSLRGLAR